VTFVQFKGDELILYPLALYFVYAFYRDQYSVAPLLARAWVPLVFLGWCLISPIWAVEPANAFKDAAYLTLTMMICYHSAAVLTPRQLMYAVLTATAIVGVLCLLVGLTGGEMNRGVFPQKNTMGKSMIMLWVAALSTSFDKGSSRRLRTMAGALAALALFLGFASESATAVLLMIGTGAIIFLGATIIQGGISRPSRLTFAFGLLAVAFLGASTILPTFQADPVELVLDQFGKDSSLTGRTGLWEYANDQIEKAPVIGVGAGGFWRYNESPLVQKIFEEYHKHSGAGFNFHNSYYEVAVHQGYIGLFFAVGAGAWALGIILRGAFSFASLPFIFFLAQATAVIARTTTESDFLRPFVLFHMLFWIGAFIVLKEEMSKRAPAAKRKAHIRANLLRR
jgi:exopolysaccharide production protein ExoQ